MYHSIRPGQIWLDTEGKRIQAHGGSIITVDGVYYWYGENKEKTTGEDKIWHWGVRCYSSRDLYNWKDEGIIIPPDLENKNSSLHPFSMMDRPHIVYNEKTGKYAAWLKIMGEPPYFAVLSADHILGPYKMVNPRVNPFGMEVGDFDIAVSAEEKRAYLYSERPHTMLYCAELNEDYTDVGETVFRAFSTYSASRDEGGSGTFYEKRPALSDHLRYNGLPSQSIGGCRFRLMAWAV